MQQNKTDLKFNATKTWQIPTPTFDNAINPKFETVSQVKFYNEYFPTSHRIFSTEWYPDLAILDNKGKFVEMHKVNRVSVPVQQMTIEIILAHLLGNASHIVDGTLNDNPALPIYKEYWTEKNIETARYEFIKSVLSLADGAILFYRDEKKLKWQVLSMFSDDKFNMEYDKYGKPHRFYKYYDNMCDVYTNELVETYAFEAEWKLKSSISHGFKGMPVVYRMRKEGAFWTRSQSNIDEIEKMLSRLSEDNRSKFKSKYHLKTNLPDDVKMQSSGLTDMVITDSDGDFKLISGADMSAQFKFEYEAQLELIFQALGIVFPRHKSSGDMPTGSMKMMFYPTERVAKALMHEFDSAIDEINSIVKQGFAAEHPKHTENIASGSIRASIRMFTPQDDTSKVDSIVKLHKEGVISGETAAEESPYAANNEDTRKEKEWQTKIAREKELSNLRLI